MKKIFFLFILSAISALAADNYFFYVNNAEEVDSYANIFNAIVKIFGSEDYLGLLRLVFLFGGFFVFISGVLTSFSRNAKGAISDYTKYILTGTAILLIIFAKNTTVIIKSKNIPTYCSPNESATADIVIDNVPEIISYTFSFFNKLGTEMTRITELGFMPPSTIYGDTTLSQNEGYLGALRNTMILLGADTSKTLNTNAGADNPLDLPKITRTLFSQCILIPFSAKGSEGLAKITEIKSSKNIYKYLSDLYTNNPTIGGINARDYRAIMNGETWKCGDLFDYAKDYFNDFKNKAACAYPEINAGAVKILTGNATPTMSDFQNVILQSGLISELQSSTNTLGIGVSGVSYATGKSKAEFVQSKLAEGAYTAEMLPYLQSILRSLLYAMLPFIFVIIILPGGLKVITEYLKSIIWIELWTPTAAILNMFMVNNAEQKMQNMYSANGLTVTNAIDYLTTGSTIAGVAGYLYASVPALTWLFLTGSETMLSNFSSGLATHMQKNIRTEAMLKDTTQVKQAKEMSYQTGEEISVAEAQHFEALKNGMVSGAVLGTEQNLGLDSVADSEVFNKSKNISSFMQLKNMTGLTAENLGSADAMTESYKKGAEIKAINNEATDSLDENSLNSKGRAAQQQDQFSKEGEINAKFNNQYSKDDHYKDQLTKHTKVFKNSKRVEADKELHKALGINLSSEQSVNRWAQSSAIKEAFEHTKNEQYTQQFTGGAYDVNEKGTYSANYGRLGRRAIIEANTERFNKDIEIATASNLQREGVSPKDIAEQKVTQTMQEIAQTEALRNAIGAVWEDADIKEKEKAKTKNQKIMAMAASQADLSYIDSKGHVHTGTYSNSRGEMAYQKIETGTNMTELTAVNMGLETAGFSRMTEEETIAYLLGGMAIDMFNKSVKTIKNAKKLKKEVEKLKKKKAEVEEKLKKTIGKFKHLTPKEMERLNTLKKTLGLTDEELAKLSQADMEEKLKDAKEKEKVKLQKKLDDIRIKAASSVTPEAATRYGEVVKRIEGRLEILDAKYSNYGKAHNSILTKIEIDKNAAEAHKELKRIQDKKITLNKVKMAAKNIPKTAAKLAVTGATKTIYGAGSVINKTSTTVIKGSVNAVKAGAGIITTAILSDALHRIAQKSGHAAIGAEIVDTLGDATMEGFKGFFRSAKYLYHSAIGDETAAAADMKVLKLHENDFMNMINRHADNIVQVVETGDFSLNALKEGVSEAATEYAEIVSHISKEVTWENTKKVAEVTGNFIESTTKETYDYYSTHSTSKIIDDTKAIFNK